MKKIWLKLLLCFCSLSAFAQNTFVPDDNFEQNLINLGYDTGPLNDYVPTTNIASITSLSLYYSGITDLTGIQAFVSLTSLNCGRNNLTTLDVTSLTQLKYLTCSDNQLTALDVSQNILLINLDCGSNQISILDVSMLTHLTNLQCRWNTIQTLNLNQSTPLNYLDCSGNVLTALNLTQNVNLVTLLCDGNTFTSLDLTKNVNLVTLSCAYGAITVLDLTNNLQLRDLTCGGALTALNITQNLQLTYLIYYGGALTTIDITHNVALTYLNCSSNTLTTINTSNNLALQTLICDYSPITSLNLTNNTALQTLQCQACQLPTLDVTHNLLLNRLWCNSNLLTSINVTQNTALQSFWCDTNQITSLNVTQNTQLTDLRCGGNPIMTLDVTHNTLLDKLYCNSNQLTVLDVTHNTVLSSFQCQNNQIAVLNVLQNPNLWEFQCQSNQLTSLNLTNNLNLGYIECGSNLLTNLDLTHQTGLRYVGAGVGATLTSIDLRNGHNSDIYSFTATGNPNLTCILVDNPAMIITYTTPPNWASWSIDGNTSYISAPSECLPPNISYTSPHTYTTGTSITPLSPTNTGGAVINQNRVSTLTGSFNQPYGVAVDATGNVYVADSGNSKIHKISSAGVVTTMAGSGTTGSIDGTGTAASFYNPYGVAVDTAGNVYVADLNNNKIRKITPAGVVTTLAGSGAAGATDGTGTAASFNEPYGVAVDAAGNVYVADSGNNKIRKITAAGVVTTVSGGFNEPWGVAVNSSGNTIYVADSGNNLIKKIDASGVVTTLAGDGSAGTTDGIGTAASFFYPTGLAVDATGNVYVANRNYHNIRKITPTGVVSTLAGSAAGYADGWATRASFFQPTGLAVDAAGNIYVADSYNNKIRKITAGGYTIFPNLPAGLSLDGATGIISGTPTACSSPSDYTVTAYNAGGSGSAIVNITIVMVAPTAAAQIFCSGATVAKLVATGTALQWYANPTGGAVLAGTTVLATGTYYVSQTLNGCESARTAVTVTINTTPAPTVDAQTFCNSGTVAGLTFTEVLGATIQWYATLRASTPLLATSALATGTYYATQTINGCESARTAVAVIVNTTPAPTAAAQIFCNGATVANLTATGIAIKWYLNATGGVALATTTALITRTYYITQTLNGCESARTAVAVTINPIPVAPKATAQIFCSGATVANLVATGTALQWYVASIGGTALATTKALDIGTYYVSQTLNGCESTRIDVKVIVNTTAAPTAAAQLFCNGATVANLVAAGTTKQWYANATGGTALVATTALITGTYYVTETLNGCESARTAVTVTVNTTPVPTVAAQAFCVSGTVANLVASGTAIKWYANPTGGAVLAGTTVLATGTYYVSQTLNGCESARTVVSVTVNTTPVPIASAQVFCNSSSIANLVVTGTALQWYASTTGGAALLATNALATGTYYVSQTLNGCESTRIAVSVTINTTAAPTASAQTLCNSGTVANLVATGTALQWYADATLGAALVATTALATGTYYVSQTLNGCESVRTAVTVAITSTPVAPTAAPQGFCVSGTVADLVATGTAIKWYLNATGGTALATTTALITRNYYTTQTLNGCESARTAVAVTVNITPAPTGVSPQVYSGTATIADLIVNGTNTKWYSDLIGGSLLPTTTPLVDGTVYYASQTLACGESPIRLAITVTSASVSTGCWSTISAGGYHTVAIKTTGSLWSWGMNNSSQLGDGTNVKKNVPTRIGSENNWLKIAPGLSHTLAIKNNGTLWAWGANSYGQLGDGTNIGKNVPIQIGTDTNWSQISANGNFSLAIKTDGTFWSWGQGNSGQLGSGTLANKNIPTQVGSLNTWSKIAAGFLHTIALKTDGSLWATGANFYGQLGDGTNIDKTSLVQIGTATNWSQISGGYHSVAIKVDGSLWAWGRNTNGQLGDNTGIDRYNPIQIGTSTDWSKISAGNQFTTALKNDNSLWSWGFNGSGQLGDGTFISKSSPTQIGTDTNWKQIASGVDHQILLKSDDIIWDCGNNTYGQLGDGTTTTISKNSPSAISCSAALNTILYNLETEILIYPNPTTSNVTIELNNLNNANLQVSDINGRILLNQKLDNTTVIDVSRFPSATYLFKVNSDQGTATSKVIKK